MSDTVKVRQLRLDQEATSGPAQRTGVDRLVEDVRLALLTSGVTFESGNGLGGDPYNSKTAAKPGKAWSDWSRRR